MDTLRSEIASRFGGEVTPNAEDLVALDGFDALEKESAVAFYAGKSWGDVLRHLRGLADEPVFGAAYYLEEWSVLAREPLRYYLRAHLEFLLDNLGSHEPDEQFVFFFLGELYRLVHGQGNPFNPEQAVVLRKVAEAAGEGARDRARFEYFGADIERQAAQCAAALG